MVKLADGFRYEKEQHDLLTAGTTDITHVLCAEESESLHHKSGILKQF